MKLNDKIFLAEEGFSITFENGVLVSIIWDRHSWCHNNVHFLSDVEFDKKMEIEKELSCKTVEIYIEKNKKPVARKIFKDFLKKNFEYDGLDFLCYLPVQYIPYILTECQNYKGK